MDIQTAEGMLKDYLLQGIAKEIFFADEAKALCVEVGNHAEKVNAQGYGQLFGSLQVSYSDRQTLCVTKMFDPEDRRFPTRSIPTVLNLIEQHASLWSLPQKHKLQETLIIERQDEQSVLLLDNTQLSLAIVAHFRKTLPQGDSAGVGQLSIALRNLREARNKVIAHNEAIAQSARTPATWGEAESLVTYAKNFVAIVSFGFLSLYLGNDSNTYHRTSDAQGTSIALYRLLKSANIVS